MTEPASAPSPRKQGFWSKLCSRPIAAAKRLEPAPATKKAVAWGSVLALLGYGGFVGYRIRSGEGMLIDIAIGSGVALLILGLLLLAVPLLRGLLRILPHALGRVGFAALLAFFLIFDFFSFSRDMAAVSALAVMATIFLGFAALAIRRSKEFAEAGRFKRFSVYASGTIAIAAIGSAIYLLGLVRGDDSHLVAPALAAGSRRVEPMPLPMDLALPGKHQLRTFTYGSGEDQRRVEFGAEVEIETESVDARPFAKLSGWTKTLRDRYWGFGVKKFPRNGRVWMPLGEGSFPLVLIVHGNHNMDDFSDPGYTYLGEHLASHGYILVSVDENFMNGSFFGGLPKENDARAWMLLKHLELFRDWAGTEGNPFFGKVDMQRISLIGHSRGGEAVGHAAAFNRLQHYPDDARQEFDFGFNIRSIIAIAPSDGQYKPAGKYTPLTDISYFTIHGAHDADVTRFVGDRQYDRVEFTGPGPWFKASLYIYRANHGQFNQVWGDTDTGAPRSWFLNRAALMSGEQQRQVAKIYFTAFLEATLRDRREYIDMFRDYRRIEDRLPDSLYVSRFQDPSFRLLSDFEEDIDVTTMTIAGGRLQSRHLAMWREGDIAMRGGGTRYNNGVHLGWQPPEQEEGEESEVAAVTAVVEAATSEPEIPSYSMILPTGFPDDFQLSADSRLVFNITTSKEKPPKPDADEDEDQDQNQQQDQDDGDGEDNADEVDEADEDDDDPKQIIDFHVELETKDGTKVALPLSQFGILPPVLKTKVTRLKMLERSSSGDYEAVMQTIEMPLSAFVAADASFDPSQLAAIHLRFDLSAKGVVILDQVGFAR